MFTSLCIAVDTGSPCIEIVVQRVGFWIEANESIQIGFLIAYEQYI